MPSIVKLLEIDFFSKYFIYIFEFRKIMVTSTYLIITLHFDFNFTRKCVGELNCTALYLPHRAAFDDT